MKAFELALAMELFFDHRNADFIGFRLQRIILNAPQKSINDNTKFGRQFLSSSPSCYLSHNIRILDLLILREQQDL